MVLERRFVLFQEIRAWLVVVVRRLENSPALKEDVIM
jgi:hypothetical protein